MVVVDNKGCHHVCTTSAGEHGVLEFTFQGLQHTTEIPTLALDWNQCKPVPSKGQQVEQRVLPKPKLQSAKSQLPGERVVPTANHTWQQERTFSC